MTARRPCSAAPGPLETYAREFDDLFGLPFRHTIDGFLRGSFGHRTGVSIDSPVRPQVQIRIVKLSIDILQVLALLASFSNDGEYRFGVSHHEYLHVYHH